MSKITPQSDKFIQALVDELEVPEERYAQAELRYKSFGDWTHREDSTVLKYDPEVYVQGSFRLGTVIKPTNKEGEYDIDLVCVLNKLSKTALTQEALKSLLESEVQSYRKAQGIKKPVKESRRCWTLEYAEGAQFHMDILPAIPNAEGQRILLEYKGMDARFSESAISITDKDHLYYGMITDDWPRSNPIGYCEWFKSQMAESFERIRKVLAEAEIKKGIITASVEDIPEYRVRTPLQQAIMILKRHRDDMFNDEPDIKPISIIITTLSAHAYDGEPDVGKALLGILERMENYIGYKDEQHVVLNPTDATENFADRWEEYPERRDAFFSWLKQARSDFTTLATLTEFKTMAESRTTHLSTDLTTRVLGRVQKLAGASLLGVATAAPAAAESDYSFSDAPRKPQAPRDFA